MLEHRAEVVPSANAKIATHFGGYNVTRVTALTAIMLDAGVLKRRKEAHGSGYVYWRCDR